VGQHSSASASRLLGLDGFEVVSAELVGGEWQLAVQTTATVIGCVGCGERAELHGRRTVRVRDLPAGGRPVVLWWRKRLWRCCEPACGVRTWTERAAAIRPRAVLTERARAEACRRVGKDAHAVAAVARDLGVGWATIMRAVADHGTPLVDDPMRLDGVATLGLDETTFLKATLGHRGRKRDPLYRIRKLLLTAAEQLTSRGRVRPRAGLAAGDPTGEVAVAWQGKEVLRAVYATGDLAHARAALGRFYRWSDGVRVAELSRLARTVRGVEAEILAFHTTGGCSNGSTEAVNLLIKKVKRVGHGFRNFGNYRLRLLLHCGIRWQSHQTVRLRGRHRRLVA